MDHYIGKLLDDRYEILEQIGNGGMAYVYKARCNRLNRNVAIKILKEEMSRDAEFRRRFHAESQAVAMLSHPNIVSVYDVSHAENLDYIVMELIEGISLKQYMEQRGKLNWREALHFTIQIAKALDHAHSRGIVHRDIKPHNIMVLKDGSVKVADFGIAQVATVQNTLTQEALGSVHYISPEQAKGAHVDTRSDIYSLGVVLYEMLTGRPPYDGETPVSVAIQHINGTPALPHTMNPTVPAALEKITMHAMAAKLEERYESAEQMLQDLEQFRKNPSTTLERSAQGEEAFIPADSAAERAVRHADRKKQPTKTKTAKSKEHRENRAAVIIGAVSIVLAFAGIAYFLYGYFFSGLLARTEEDIVPNFLGQHYQDIDVGDYQNFEIVFKDWKSSNLYDYGYIMDQSPSANRPAKVGSKIELTISTGEDGNIMPNLVNHSMQNAQAALNTLSVGVVVRVSNEPSEEYTDGYVIRTEPAVGHKLTEGQVVTLVISQGNAGEMGAVPALVGLHVEQALLMIDQYGFARGSVLSVDSELPMGTVTFQSLPSEEEARKGSVINLQISRGSGEAGVPELISQSSNLTAYRGDDVVLEVEAKTNDAGVLSYVWYVSKTPDAEKAEIISRSDEQGAKYQIDTTNDGTFYYFCRITNTLGSTSEYVYSDMIRVTIEKDRGLSEKEIEILLPEEAGKYIFAVYVDDEMQIEPFEVDTREVSGKGIYLTVKGTGTQSVDVYLDGDVYQNWLIDFDTVG